MEIIKEMVVRIKRENVIVYALLFILCFLNIIINVDAYKRVLFNSYDQATKLEDLDKNYRFISLDLKNSISENYIIDYNKEKIKIYTSNIDNQNILILLKDNTLITDKVILQKFNDDNLINDLNNKFKDKNYYKVVLSNINYNSERNLELNKIYVLSGLFVISFILLIKNLIQMINPTKTRLYKMKLKEYNIN